MTAISSLQNARVKNAVRLRDRRQRSKQGRILIDGARELGRAIGAGVELLEVFVSEQLCESPDGGRLLAEIHECGAEVIRVTEPVFAKLAFGDRAEGLLGVAATPSADLGNLSLPENPLVVVLEGVEKPGNLGAVLRSADAGGVSAVVLADTCCDPFNPNAIRASLGTIFTTPLASATTNQTLNWLALRGLQAYAAQVDGAASYTEIDFTGPSAIVLGSEAHGLSDAWTTELITPVRLPMLGVADSLNVSATAAVLVYEALRQRGTG
jgi:TrmH family RNA methyltransferase